MQNNCVVANTSFRFSWNLISSFLLVGPQCMSQSRWQVAILFSNYSRRDKYIFSSLWILARKRSNEEKSNFTLAITRNNCWFMAHNSLTHSQHSHSLTLSLSLSHSLTLTLSHSHTHNSLLSTSGTSFSSTSSRMRSCFWVKMSLYFRQFRLPTICLPQLIGSLPYAV